MSRPLSIVLADAFDRAAHDVAMAEQVHHHHNDPAPTRMDNLTYWFRGFFAGLADDHHSKPVLARAYEGASHALTLALAHVYRRK